MKTEEEEEVEDPNTINNLNVDLTCTHIEAGNSTIDINSAIKEEDYIIVDSSVCGGGST